MVQQRITRRLERVTSGHYGDYERVGEGIYELKFHFGPGYRIYFAEQDNAIVLLLCGGNKSSQSEDIKKLKCIGKNLRGKNDE